MNFSNFKNAVASQFAKMQNGKELFRTSVDPDYVWDTYLNSFPEGTNPIYRKREYYNCSCCRNFIKNVGNVVVIKNGKLVSIWDCDTKDEAYQIVADALSNLVKSYPVDNAFLHREKFAGTDKNFEQMVTGVKTWEHFFVNIDPVFVSRDIPTALSKVRSSHDVYARALSEISIDSIDTVLELIAQNSLYRGEEHKFVVTEFRKLKIGYMNSENRDLFTWKEITKIPESVKSIRNSAIGTLLVDLSEGKELEYSVKSFETKVAPHNYKRPTALVTKSMVESAKNKIEELGLTSALDRRFANIGDITINNILFANKSAKNKIVGNDVFDEITSGLPEKPKNLDKIDEIPIEKFISNVLPNLSNMEILFDNNHSGNLVSLIAPVNPTSGNLFKWNNKFSWSYTGEVADSIKERVKNAGGEIVADLCCRLAWNNTDDLDLHMIEPNKNRIWFSDRTSKFTNGKLDVDMNANTSNLITDPVENIFYKDKSRMLEGVYELVVNQYSKRNSSDCGFDVQIDFMGDIYNFSYDQIIPNKKDIAVAKFRYSHNDGITFIESLPKTTRTKVSWGISTNVFYPVSVLMNSPNYWDGNGIGNKHYFFMIDGCVNDGSARGFYNEFLKQELDQHRKVFEVVGGKLKIKNTNNQLSGLGFSTTKRDSVLCRITGKFTRLIKIVF